MTELQTLLKRHYDCIPAATSPLFMQMVDRAIAMDNKVYLLVQMTQCPEDLVLEIVNEGVLSLDEAICFAEIYHRFANVNESEEIYLMGFENWNRLNLL